MSKKMTNIIIIGFVSYIAVGIVMNIIFTDDQMVSAQTLQDANTFSPIGSYAAVAVRTVVNVLFWPSHAFILAVN